MLAALPGRADPEVGPRGTEAIPVLREVWQLGSEQIYPAALAGRFDERTLARLETELRETQRPLADVLNPFLASLRISHTRFYDRRHQGYYLLRSLFTTRDPDQPSLYTLGVQLREEAPDRIRAVFEGSDAQRAGLSRGQRIVAVNGAPFSSLLQWQTPEPVRLTVESAAGRQEVAVRPVWRGFHAALADATAASRRFIPCGSRRVAYLHLWSGTDSRFLDTLIDAVASARAAAASGFVLDLRDGHGGAWWEYLDPFFADRERYFAFTIVGRDGESEPFRAEPRANPDAWLGPLAVLINDGTRSGKESLAYQFKHTGRATLVGTTTAGAFVAGYGAFADRDADYAMMMAVEERRLDGTVIEGIGVAPDITVPEREGVDAPLDAALEALSC
ncbi:MAG: S41 family peptidase [Pseudomonadales bacterium]